MIINKLHEKKNELFFFFTEPSPLYDNNHYHEECLRCNSCGLNLTGPNQKRARRFKNQILCDLHFADVALMECSDFMQQLRSFKPQSLGCAVARRKSSTTLIFPLPPQACSGKSTILLLTIERRLFVALSFHFLLQIKFILSDATSTNTITRSMLEIKMQVSPLSTSLFF